MEIVFQNSTGRLNFQNSTGRLNFLCRLPDIKIGWINHCKEKAFLVTTEKFDLETSCMQKQCNFLTYLYQEYEAIGYVFLDATGSEMFECNNVGFASLFYFFKL